MLNAEEGARSPPPTLTPLGEGGGDSHEPQPHLQVKEVPPVSLVTTIQAAHRRTGQSGGTCLQRYVRFKRQCNVVSPPLPKVYFFFFKFLVWLCWLIAVVTTCEYQVEQRFEKNVFAKKKG